MKKHILVFLIVFAVIGGAGLTVALCISGYAYYTHVDRGRGSVDNSNQLPFFGKQIDALPAEGEIRYAYVKHWGGKGLLLTGKTTFKQFRIYCQKHGCTEFLIDQNGGRSWAYKIIAFDANSCDFPVPKSKEIIVFQNSNFARQFVFLASYIEERGQFIAEIWEASY